MKRFLSRMALVPVLVIAACGGDSDPEVDRSTCTYDNRDTDGDFIDDCTEGWSEERNTDADEWPDWRDLDSDGDFLTDADEAGDEDLATPPVDSNSDGIPDYLDPDSDGDGVLDGLQDADGDGVPDAIDIDADGDTISDADEGRGDTDSDGIPNRLDRDSDNDGFLDSDEAGDDDPATPPIDTDGDELPDFLDLDSDNDGTVDLIERAAGSDPLDAASGVPEGDFFFVLPYESPARTGTFDFSTDLRQADIFFSVDTTGSFDEEIAEIQRSLQETIIAGVQAQISDVAFGVGRFEDFPLDPYGLDGDVPFELLQPVTTDAALVQAAVDKLAPAAGGLDTPEAGMEALHQWATGAGVPAFGYEPFYNGGVGGVGFRPFSLPIFVQITDARSHEPADYATFADELHTEAEVLAALDAIGAKVVGIDSLENAGTPDDPRAELERLATETGTVIAPDGTGMCATGVGGAPNSPVDQGGTDVCPLVFDVAPDGSGLGDLIVDGILDLATLGSLDISADPAGFTQELDGTPLPPGIDTSMLIEAVTPVEPAPNGSTIVGDEFVGVPTGSTVTFEVTARNMVLPATFSDQVMQVDINVLGDAVTLLDVRRVFIIVPRRTIQ